jgi:FHA domain/Domain of unknown function (DUF1707)
MRPSEETREHALARLRRGYVAGLIDLETLARRIEGALSVGSDTELHGLTADLPAAHRRPRWPRRRRDGVLPPPHELAGGRLLLGRSSSCQLQFADDTVSRRHAELRLEHGSWILRDLGSSNGTWVNDRRVIEAEVVAGDVLCLGGCRFRL